MYLSTLLPGWLAAIGSPFDVPSITRRDAPSILTLTLSLPSSSLPPAPPNGTVLKYVAIGLGTQNYTCAASSSTAAPSSFGAEATLYDAGGYLEAHPDMIGILPAKALELSTASGGLVSFGETLGLPVLGEHFFDDAFRPTFDLYAVDAQLLAKRVADVPAPADAPSGPDGAGAVDWLYLVDASDGDGATYGGVTAVYRVETAGGECPETCENSAKLFGVPYSAEYWFYGPPSSQW